jgi:hypothetical protein
MLCKYGWRPVIGRFYKYSCSRLKGKGLDYMHILDYIALHKEDCPENTISVIRKALHDIDT